MNGSNFKNTIRVDPTTCPDWKNFLLLMDTSGPQMCPKLENIIRGVFQTGGSDKVRMNFGINLTMLNERIVVFFFTFEHSYRPPETELWGGVEIVYVNH